MSELNYTVTGNGNPLLVMHGLFGSGKNWQSHARQFAAHFEVFNIDLRNHGESFHADEMNYSAMADDVLRLIQSLEIDHCHVLGHSMGGKVAMTLAAKNPSLLDRLVIADIAPVSYFHHYDDLIEPMLALRLDRLHSRAEADQLLRQNIPEDQLRAFLLHNLARTADSWRWRVNWEVIQRDMEWLTGFTELPDDWMIDVPTLFLRGAKSDYIGAPEIEVIEAHFDNARIGTIDDAGHWLHAEQPQLFTRLVVEFLQAG